jgi:CHASE2 domain-containing sensor protein
MPTKKETTSAVAKRSESSPMRGKMTARYLTELARFSTWLSSALIVAMTFLLLAGLRSPKMPLLVSLYVTLGAFGLSLLCYLVTGWFMMRLMDGAELTTTAAAVMENRLNLLRKLQQLPPRLPRPSNLSQ